MSLVFFSLIPPPPRSTLFPYTTLFRSVEPRPNARRRAVPFAPRRRLRKCGVDIGEHLQQPIIVAESDFDDRLLKMFAEDRKSTRLNSSHQIISYAVFCLKKKKSYT